MTAPDRPPLRPLDAIRSLRDLRCTATLAQRWCLAALVLRADNDSWQARVSMTTIANDMNVARRTAVTVIAELVRAAARADAGIPIAVKRETGRKVRGHRRETNTYVLSIPEGWARDAYENREGGALGKPDHQSNGVGEAAALGQQDHQSNGDRRSPTLGKYDHQVGDPVAQVLPSSLPIRSAQRESSPPKLPVSKTQNADGETATFVPLDLHRELASKKGLDVDHELAKMLAWQKANGQIAVDIGAAFELWLLNAWSAESGAPNNYEAPKLTAAQREQQKAGVAKRMAALEAATGHARYSPSDAIVESRELTTEEQIAVRERQRQRCEASEAERKKREALEAKPARHGELPPTSPALHGNGASPK